MADRFDEMALDFVKAASGRGATAVTVSEIAAALRAADAAGYERALPAEPSPSALLAIAIAAGFGDETASAAMQKARPIYDALRDALTPTQES